MVGRLFFVSFWGLPAFWQVQCLLVSGRFLVRHGFFCFKTDPVDVEDIAESDAKGLSSPLAPSALHVLQDLDSLLALQKPDEASTKVIKTCESSVLGMHSNFM